MATDKRLRAAAPKRMKVALSRTRAQFIIDFVEKYILVPEGMLVGKPMVLLPEQIDFVKAVYDNLDAYGKMITRRGIFSIARKNGKTGLISALLGAHIFGPEAKTNSQLFSAARSRDQAALVFGYLAKSVRMNSALEGLVQITDSGKRIQGLAVNALYRALSADSTTAHGLSPSLTMHDELGQVIGPVDGLYDALETAGGAQEEPLSLIISTQAASDTDLLSILIDDALRSPTPETVIRLYAAAKDANIQDPKVWAAANFALGKFRSEKEFAEAAGRALRLPSFEPTFRNLYLNQRVSLLSLLVTPTLWRECETTIKESLFFEQEVACGLDLSGTTDLTAAVLSVQDPVTGRVHVAPYVFTPIDGLEERSRIDRAPYHVWAQNSQIIALPGKVINYDMVAEYMAAETKDMNLRIVAFDRWRINDFKMSAERTGFGQGRNVVWSAVGQGMRDMSPRVEKFEELLLKQVLAHGGHPALNMAAANAIVVKDPAGNRKPEKAKSSARIDPLVACIMSVYALLVPDEGEAKPVVSDKSLFFV